MKLIANLGFTGSLTILLFSCNSKSLNKKEEPINKTSTTEVAKAADPKTNSGIREIEISKISITGISNNDTLKTYSRIMKFGATLDKNKGFIELKLDGNHDDRFLSNYFQFTCSLLDKNGNVLNEIHGKDLDDDVQKAMRSDPRRYAHYDETILYSPKGHHKIGFSVNTRDLDYIDKISITLHRVADR